MDKENDMFQQKIVNKFDRGTFISVSKPQLQKQVDPISKNLHQTVFSSTFGAIWEPSACLLPVSLVDNQARFYPCMQRHVCLF